MRLKCFTAVSYLLFVVGVYAVGSMLAPTSAVAREATSCEGEQLGASGASVLFERAEAGDGHCIALLHGGHDGVQQRLENAASFGLGQFMRISQALNQVSFIHDGSRC